MARRSANHDRYLSAPIRRSRGSLVRLQDGGPEVRIDAAQFGVEGRDRSWNRFAQSFLAVNAAPLALLDVAGTFVADTDEVRLALRPGGTVGAVPLFSPVTHKIAGTIVISPRFGWSGIGPALEQVGWSAAPEILSLPAAPGSAREVPPWVLAGPIIGRFAALLRDDRRTFRETVETRVVPRGQVLWPLYASHQLPAGRPHRIPCRYSDLGADEELRAYVRWGLESVRQSLLPWSRRDVVCRNLLDRMSRLLTLVEDVKSRRPERTALVRLKRLTMAGGESLTSGLEALGWLVDERGLAGPAEPDGLSWRMAMRVLFERWVESLSSLWAKSFGGVIRSGHGNGTLIPIRWRSGTARGLSHLMPDITVEHGDRIWIIDAKYKSHFEEMDESRWRRMRDELREEHRRDTHQVLAYAAAHGGKRVTCVLAYPMRRRLWERLSATGSTVSRAVVEGGGSEIELVLAGVPLDISEVPDLSSFVAGWNRELLAAA